MQNIHQQNRMTQNTAEFTSDLPKTSGEMLFTVVWIWAPVARAVRLRSDSSTRPAQKMLRSAKYCVAKSPMGSLLRTTKKQNGEKWGKNNQMETRKDGKITVVVMTCLHALGHSHTSQPWRVLYLPRYLCPLFSILLTTLSARRDSLIQFVVNDFPFCIYNRLVVLITEK